MPLLEIYSGLSCSVVSAILTVLQAIPVSADFIDRNFSLRISLRAVANLFVKNAANKIQMGELGACRGVWCVRVCLAQLGLEGTDLK